MDYLRLGRNNWPKPASSLKVSEAILNQAVWPVISPITGPICALALKLLTSDELSTRGHHDWPVMGILRQSRGDHSSEHSAGVDAKHGDRNGDGQLEVV